MKSVLKKPRKTRRCKVQTRMAKTQKACFSDSESDKKVYHGLWATSGGILGALNGGVGIAVAGTAFGIPGILAGALLGKLIASLTDRII